MKIDTDYAIFLFDNGETNMIASLLKYARKHHSLELELLNFRIVFMGASLDAMAKEPFSLFPQKMLNYQSLGISEKIDRHWKRDQKISSESLQNLHQHLHVSKKVWVGVSCTIFEQLLHLYQGEALIEALALRDNPFSAGDTDYFSIADQIQQTAKKVAMPSREASEKFFELDKQIIVVGHPPTEDWKAEAKNMDREAILKRLNLNENLPILVYAGTYGPKYETCFRTFLDLFQEGTFHDLQLIVLPHPRYKGDIEKKVYKEYSCKNATFLIAGEFEENPSNHLKTIEALCIADAVITSDATSTVVLQAKSLWKPVLYINPFHPPVGEKACSQKLINKIFSLHELEKAIEALRTQKSGQTQEDVFYLLGIPKNGAKLLWKELVSS